MEEKLRNLSQNIANNTGNNAHKPEETPPPEPEEPHEEKAPEEEPHEETHDEPLMDEAEENVPEEDIDIKSSEKARPETVSRNPHEDFAQPLGTQRARSATESEPRDDGSERTGSKDEHFGAPDTEKENSSDSSSAKILTMDTDEPQESPARTQKYSPEVEAALNRLNSEDASVDLSTEPLSTEPKKQSHAGRIFLVFLLILALAATAVCILVEQNIIDNPLNLINKKDSSQVVNLPANTAPTNNDDAAIEELVKSTPSSLEEPNTPATDKTSDDTSTTDTAADSTTETATENQ